MPPAFDTSVSGLISIYSSFLPDDPELLSDDFSEDDLLDSLSDDFFSADSP